VATRTPKSFRMYFARLVTPDFKLVSEVQDTLPTIAAWLAEHVERPTSYDGLARHFRLFDCSFGCAYLSAGPKPKKLLLYLDKAK
jgi:hypothetical protein